MFRQIGIGAAATLLAGALAIGCSDDGGDTIILGGSRTEPTRANSISTDIDQSWADNESSLNRGPVSEFGDLKVLRSADGSGIVIWSQGGSNGDDHLFVARYDSSGNIGEPFAVANDPDADFAGSDAFDRSANSAVAVFAPNGVAIAFIARQAVTPGVAATTDVESDRVYYLLHSNSGGFVLDGPIDSNASGSAADDNAVHTLMLVSNLVDGQQTYGNNFSDLDERPIGTKGDSANNVTEGAAFVWIYEDANDDTRIEGRFIDLDDGDLSALAQVSVPGIASGEDVSQVAWTSGDELLIQWTDTNATFADPILVLYRLNFATSTFGSGTAVTRPGTLTAAETVQNVTLIGDGYRAINGMNETVVLFESTHEDASTDADNDLMVARVDAAGAVTFADIDHDDNTGDTNALLSHDIQFERGAPAIWVFYRQVVDPVGGVNSNNAGLFVRYIRLDDGSTLAERVSAEDQVSTVNNDDVDAFGNVVEFSFAETDPFCSPDTNGEATFVAFVQQTTDVNTTTTEENRELRGALITVADINADPPVVTAAADTLLQDDTDLGYGDSLAGSQPVIVLPSSDPSGTGIVFWVGQVNNLSNNAATGAFTNLRAFVSSTALPTSATTSQALATTQIGSGATLATLPFADFQQVTSTQGAQINAIATPDNVVQRDYLFDLEEVAPQFAYFMIPEFIGDDDSVGGETWRGRTLNLATQTFTAVNDRFFPALTDDPELIGTTGEHFNNLDEAVGEPIAQGNAVVFLFNAESAFSNSNTVSGRYYVNTAAAGGNWSDAALLTNDSTDEISDHGELNGDEVAFAPGVLGRSCDTAIGSQFFYIRELQDSNTGNFTYRMQRRFFNGVALQGR